MNVIYFNTHDTGRYISPYGYKVPTPYIEEFARDAIMFRNAFCASPTCTPSRGALLSGMMPHSNGLIGLSHRGFRLNDYDKHLGKHLKDNGYNTVICGTEHIANIGLFKQHDMDYDVLPYETILGRVGEEGDFDNALRVAAFIEAYESDKPFFLSFGLWNTHRAYPEETLKGYESDYVRVPANVPSTKEARLDFAHYCNSVWVVDQCFKKIVEALKKRGIYDETIIIFTTDHGLPNPEMKCSLYDDGIETALIIRDPRQKNKGAVDGLFSQIDLFPTICDCLNIKVPDYVEGVSQYRVMSGESEKERNEIFGEINFHASYQPQRMIRTERYKYIESYYDYSKPMLANSDTSKVKDFLLQNGYHKKENERCYLFDLVHDANESNNLINDKTLSEVKNELKERLHSWMYTTKDFLANGEISLKNIAVDYNESSYPKESYKLFVKKTIYNKMKKGGIK